MTTKKGKKRNKYFEIREAISEMIMKIDVECDVNGEFYFSHPKRNQTESLAEKIMARLGMTKPQEAHLVFHRKSKPLGCLSNPPYKVYCVRINSDGSYNDEEVKEEHAKLLEELCPDCGKPWNKHL